MSIQVKRIMIGYIRYQRMLRTYLAQPLKNTVIVQVNFQTQLFYQIKTPKETAIIILELN
jgi:hypothetical protein